MLYACAMYVESVHVNSLLAKQSLKTRYQQYNFSNPTQSIVSPNGDNRLGLNFQSAFKPNVL